MFTLRSARVVVLALAIAMVPFAVFASEEEHGDEHGDGHVRDVKNEVALFAGWTDEHGHDAELSWGFDYKRVVAKRWAAGGYFDYAGGDLRNLVVGGLVFVWPGLGNLQLFAGPGVEFHNGRGGGDGHGEADEDETQFLFRIGVAYDLHIGEHYGIVPTVMLDFVDNEEVWVYGLAFTYAW